MANLPLLVSLLFLALSVQNGDSVRCYSCSSSVNPICNDPFPVDKDKTSSLLVDCNAPSSNPYLYNPKYYKYVCQKQKQFYNDTEVVVTSRGCVHKLLDSDIANTNDCPNPDSFAVVPFFCETCETDGCNGEATTT